MLVIQTYVAFHGSPSSTMHTLQLNTQVTFSKSRSETFAMPMICSLIPVFSVVGKMMLYSDKHETVLYRSVSDVVMQSNKNTGP